MTTRPLLAPAIGATVCMFLAARLLAADNPALTIYNGGFAVVRDVVPLDLHAGENRIRWTETTARLEPDTVILRDPAAHVPLQILEQNYRAEPVSQESLLSLHEGETIDFLVNEFGSAPRVIPGRIVRSAYRLAASRLPNENSEAAKPIIEVDGKLRFSLPGEPLFPPLSDGSVLKPTLDWLIQTPAPARLNAELSYITAGMSWQADYNLVASAGTDDTLELIGYVTVNNRSGKTFKDARVKLMAGEVSKLKDDDENRGAERVVITGSTIPTGPFTPAVVEKAFDDFHLYTLSRPATLRDGETKQVEFIRAAGVNARRVYIYDGFRSDRLLVGGYAQDYSMESIREQPGFGTQFTPKVKVMREIKNAEVNHLGLPLPKGRLRFYRREDDGQLEFIGENQIDHTPKDETVSVHTGFAFDLTGERQRKAFQISEEDAKHWIDETFEITLRNHKQEPVEIRAVEHLYRWTNWRVTEKTAEFTPKDAQTIEFLVSLRPDESKTFRYTVHYSW